MITPEQIEALTAAERASLARQLADIRLPQRQRVGPPPVFGHAIRVIVTIGAVVMVPWTIYLALSLQRRTVTEHWRLAWVGFDLLIAVALGCTAWWAWHRRHLVIIGLTTSAVLLVCDAWFDVTLSKGGDRWIALGMALLVELPLAGLFGWAIVALQRASAVVVWTLSGQDGPLPSVWRMPLIALVAPIHETGADLSHSDARSSADRSGHGHGTTGRSDAVVACPAATADGAGADVVSVDVAGVACPAADDQIVLDRTEQPDQD
ncbi:MAG TPA: hypothetical protein PLS63_00560 [Microthrixaceae bacterium]|mgnify:FL=1|nr:hypothetical protein [Microthrixaceae bacterium]